MKNIIQILILISIFGCGNNQSSKNKLESKSNPEKKVKNKISEVQFAPDSYYVKYWCSTEILKKTSESLDKLELTIVAKFLATFHKDCRNNIEYSEWSNELLFEVANRSPDFLLQLLHKNSSLDKDFIKSEFESPIHDGIKLEEIIRKIETANSPMRIKNEIVEALKIAKSKF